MRPGHVLLALLAVAVVLSSASPSEASCTAPGDLRAFRRALSAELRCRERASQTGADPECGHLPIPACASSSFEELIDLVFGDGSVGLGVPITSEWICQKLIVSATRSFLTRRLRELVDGRRWTRRSTAFQRMASGCSGLTANRLPRPGGDCASLVAPGQPIDGAGLASCVRGSLERILQDVTGVALRPNIVVVLTDDQRWDTLGVMPRARKLLADRGIEFTQSFVNTSLCCPDRASILTGQYAHNHGVQTNLGALAFDDSDTIAVHLKSAGYRTALIGKYMVNTGAALGTSVPPGWDEWRVFMDDLDLYYDYVLNENGTFHPYGTAAQDYSTDVLSRFTGDFIRAQRDAPFFVIFAPFAPHTVATPAPRHEGIFQGIAPWRPPNWCEADTSDKPRWVRNIRNVLAGSPNTVPQADQRRVDQLETLLAVDEAVEQLSATLEGLGLTDNTVVIFTSDNGFLWLEHWLPLKNYPYEESIRVPFLLRYPKVVPAPRQMDSFVLHIDLAPTFAELAQATAPAATNGTSLVPLLHDETSGWREDLLIEHFQGALIAPHAGVRTRRWKYIETDATTMPNRELYDLEADPHELENIAADPTKAQIIAELAARLALLRAE